MDATPDCSISATVSTSANKKKKLKQIHASAHHLVRYRFKIREGSSKKPGRLWCSGWGWQLDGTKNGADAYL